MKFLLGGDGLSPLDGEHQMLATLRSCQKTADRPQGHLGNPMRNGSHFIPWTFIGLKEPIRIVENAGVYWYGSLFEKVVQLE